MSSSERGSDRWAPWGVLVIILIISAISTRYVWDSSRVAGQVRFNTAVRKTHDAIEFRLDTYVNVLRAASGLFSADHSLTRDQFRQYLRHMQVAERYPGVQGIGLSLRVRPADVESVAADVRANDYPDFRIWPEQLRPEYHSIVVLEPMDRRNRAAIGFDMYTNLARREAMARARDTGEPTATAKVMLVQEIDPAKQAGFLMYVPVYAVDRPATVTERRETLYGFVYVPFRANDFFAGIFGSESSPDVRFTIYDGETLLYRSGPPGLQEHSPFTQRSTLQVGGREWTIVFEPLPGEVTAPWMPAMMTALVGLAIGLLLFALLYVQSRARRSAELTTEQLRRSEAALQHANQAKDEFLATLSHELRTPMTAIMGWSKLLADDLDDETRDTAVEAIGKSSRAQARLIDDLLDVSRIISGKMRVEPRPLELGPVVKAAVEAVAPAADAKGLEMPTSVPTAPIVVNGDPHRLQQVFWNLLSNAVKFTPDGGNVRVALEARGNEAVITVTDSGQGIEPQFIPFVFERFRQADSSSTRAYSGLGLGLAIVRHLVEMHGGTVSAESPGLGKGSRFIVRLPRLKVRERTVAKPVHDDVAVNAVLRGATILVVDDEDDVRRYVDTVFRLSGAEVESVTSGREALDALSSRKIDVVVSDIGMPGMDGFELAREIRKLPELADVPLIALSAYARPEDRERAEAAGFDAFISKPADPPDLRALVAEALMRRKG